tara:strand:+ start:20 stop:586 length:567 start_codon:yes stop_codon:yes gene_type:complete
MSTLKVNSIIPVAGVPTGGGGGIIQIVQKTKTDTSTTSVTSNTTSTAFESVSSMTHAITPISASSKILVDFMFNCTVGSNGTLLMMTLVRKIGSGSFAEIGDYLGDSDGSRTRCSITLVPEHNGYSCNQARLSFLDSPSTTDTVTYGVRVRHDAGSTLTVYINRSYHDSNQVFIPRPCTVFKLSEVSA